MRGLLLLIALILIYYALKRIFLSALKSSGQTSRRSRLKGEEMVLDPECKTYVVKDRAVERRVHGSVHYFCSEACADRYAKKQDV